ncbi:MAG TPA: hypothetical protein VFY18_14330 [Candidatus Limnocylindrales bacterium]|nr:hypothetical protein [Candidatus Limnocylindrales bacterium]
MTFEQRSAGVPAEPGPTSAAVASPVQIRLQILSTEHWSLLASRSLAWNESFARAGMFLSTLSGSIVALSLIGGVDGFHDAFFVVALVVLPVDLFVGIGTWLRMGATNYHDAVTVIGMNRIRAAYLEIAPDLEPYFVMGVHDDAPGVGITMAVPPGTAPLVHLIAGTPTLVMVLNGVVAGAITALVLIRFASPDSILTLAASLFVVIIVVVAEFNSARGKIRRAQRALRPIFPTPSPDERPGA